MFYLIIHIYGWNLTHLLALLGSFCRSQARLKPMAISKFINYMSVYNKRAKNDKVCRRIKQEFGVHEKHYL